MCLHVLRQIKCRLTQLSTQLANKLFSLLPLAFNLNAMLFALVSSQLKVATKCHLAMAAFVGIPPRVLVTMNLEFELEVKFNNF